MELDDLKILLKSRLDDSVTVRPAEQLALLMRKRSGDIMQKIRKNLLTELFLCFVFLIGFVLLLFYFDHLYAITLAVLGIILSVFFGTLFGSL
ncbi:MAG: hypothetical protein H7Y27_05060, partial [Gemmatimonadaceae bacterium]|nr:hypothetical protein [Chitinophagaceae bacterium]